jgi:hypothetical protein
MLSITWWYTGMNALSLFFELPPFNFNILTSLKKDQKTGFILSNVSFT